MTSMQCMKSSYFQNLRFEVFLVLRASKAAILFIYFSSQDNNSLLDFFFPKSFDSHGNSDFATRIVG